MSDDFVRKQIDYVADKRYLCELFNELKANSKKTYTRLSGCKLRFMTLF